MCIDKVCLKTLFELELGEITEEEAAQRIQDHGDEIIFRRLSNPCSVTYACDGDTIKVAK